MRRTPKLVRVYSALLKAAWGKALEYRAQAVLWILTAVFPLVMMSVWLTLVDEAGPVTGWNQKDFISYYVAAALVYQLTFAWVIWVWNDEIRTGNLSFKLLKPLEPIHHLLSEQIGHKFFVMLVLVPIVALVAWLSPAIQYPISAGRLAAFALAVMAGFATSALMGSAFGMLAFWSTQSSNLYSLWIGVGSFLSGWIAPLPLFPAAIRQIASWLPFRSTLSFPVEILMGQLTWAQTLFGFAVTLGWILIFWVAYTILWRLGLRRYEAVGA